MTTSHDLHEFVREALARGMSRGGVEDVLIRAGWSASRARAAIAAFADVDFAIPVPRPQPQVDARDAFLYALLFATLYVSCFSFGNLAFQLIDRAFPDPAFDQPRAVVLEVTRWSIAALVVALPVFLLLSARVQAARRTDQARRGSVVRRWLTYLTLALASTIVIGDVVALVYYLLAGELSIRFLAKIAVVAAIAGGVFLYYLWDLKFDEKGTGAAGTPVRRVSGAVVGLTAATAVAAGVVMAGPPGEARLRRFDEQRLTDLRRIVTAVEDYRTRAGTLPASLEAIDESGVWRSQPRDPETDRAYGYRTAGSVEYELCADFNRPAEDDSRFANRDAFSRHQAGRQCFQLMAKQFVEK